MINVPHFTVASFSNLIDYLMQILLLYGAISHLSWGGCGGAVEINSLEFHFS